MFDTARDALDTGLIAAYTLSAQPGAITVAIVDADGDALSGSGASEEAAWHDAFTSPTEEV